MNTILKNSFVKENDLPWKGEEEPSVTVLRMLVDKYPPLKIKRNSIKEYIDFHNINKKEKIQKLKEAKQTRLLNAKDAAIDYRWNSLVESRIQKAMAAGEFKNLPYHGKKIPTDPGELVYLFYFLNRLIQRQGSAPAWIEMQAELDKEIQNFRKHVREIWLKYAKINKLAPNKADSAWEQSNFNFFQVSIKTLNNRLRSYNTIAPYSVRRIYLTVEGELNKMYHDMKNINSNSDDNDEDDGKIKHLDKYN
ncbi:11977_t:CDS:2 [Entrophospora sp. SA101]|nr:11127_t:CDS:2 [Entrophospora sp. SA101]CAJ0747944.1 11977_t:CDS:2 [Entrophospora sp. SA101]